MSFCRLFGLRERIQSLSVQTEGSGGAEGKEVCTVLWAVDELHTRTHTRTHMITHKHTHTHTYTHANTRLQFQLTLNNLGQRHRLQLSPSRYSPYL